MPEKKTITLKADTAFGKIHFKPSVEIEKELQEDDGRLEKLLLYSLVYGLKEGWQQRYWLKRDFEEFKEAEAKLSDIDAAASRTIRHILRLVIPQKPKRGRGKPKAIETMDGSEMIQLYLAVKELIAEGNPSKPNLAERLCIGGSDNESKRRGLDSYLKARGTTYQKLVDEVSDGKIFGSEVW